MLAGETQFNAPIDFSIKYFRYKLVPYTNISKLNADVKLKVVLLKGCWQKFELG